MNRANVLKLIHGERPVSGANFFGYAGIIVEHLGTQDQHIIEINELLIKLCRFVESIYTHYLAGLYRDFSLLLLGEVTVIFWRHVVLLGEHDLCGQVAYDSSVDGDAGGPSRLSNEIAPR